MQTFKLALDWTPNANHIGFLVAQAKRFYKDYGLNIKIMSPDTDNYSITPAKKVEQGLADFALCPTESLISYQTKSKTFALVGVSSIFQDDLSAVCVLKSSGITSPKALNGKTYASYKARYEDGIVKAMIKNDGGEGDLKISYPDKLGIWNRIVDGNADSTWIFLNWEALQAEAEGIALTNFKLEDYDIPYSYSPLIAANRNTLNHNHNAVMAFLEATKQGYYDAKENAEDAADILYQLIPQYDQNIDLVKAIDITSKALGPEKSWGTIEMDRVHKFLKWLRLKNLEHSDIKVKDLVWQS